MSVLSEWLRKMLDLPKTPTPAVPANPTQPPAAGSGAVGAFERLTTRRLEVRGGAYWLAAVSHPHGELEIELLDATVTPMIFVGTLNVRPGGQLQIRLRHDGTLFELPVAALKAVADAYALGQAPNPNP